MGLYNPVYSKFCLAYYSVLPRRVLSLALAAGSENTDKAYDVIGTICHFVHQNCLCSFNGVSMHQNCLRSFNGVLMHTK